MRELDLHGTRHKDAEGKLIRFIKETKSIRPAIIITGNSVRMKQIAIDVIEKCGLKYKHRDYYNLGSYIIYD
jgi:hypothetical protein